MVYYTGKLIESFKLFYSGALAREARLRGTMGK